jgi:hypothetical protein
MDGLGLGLSLARQRVMAIIVVENDQFGTVGGTALVAIKIEVVISPCQRECREAQGTNKGHSEHFE